ncbi:MAG: hypothetical protein PHO37_09785 [Kiritimatiellae bacterium]|nr:hypothetical protein [Kiritimatiellia bacterium]
MTVLEAARRLNAEVIVEGDAVTHPIRHVVASDLMSDVLLVDDEDILLLTSLASDQVLRTAHIIGAVGVIVVNGKSLPTSMVQVARDLGITLIKSDKTKYGACIAIHEALERV